MSIDLNKSPLSALVAEYNKLTGASVKRFPDRKTAIKRLTPVLPKEVSKPKHKGVMPKGTTKREQLVQFIKTPRTVEEICAQFGIKRNTAFTNLADIANPRYCGKALGSPVKVARTEEGKVFAV